MITQTTKPILFIFLNVGILFALVGTNVVFAEEQTNTIYDPVVVQYIKELISQPDKNIQEKIIDGETVTVITNTQQITADNYLVKTTTNVDHQQVMTEIFNISIHDGAYKLVNHNLGIRETFTDVSQDATGDGSGRSTYNGARISLYDREYGTPHALYLSDNYSGCGIANQATVQATVRPDTIDVNWNAHPFYLHWCIVPLEFTGGDGVW